MEEIEMKAISVRGSCRQMPRIYDAHVDLLSIRVEVSVNRGLYHWSPELRGAITYL
jgi:hypothetical protein